MSQIHIYIQKHAPVSTYIHTLTEACTQYICVSTHGYTLIYKLTKINKPFGRLRHFAEKIKLTKSIIRL